MRGGGVNSLALVDTLKVGERHCSSLVYTSKKYIKKYGVNVDVQKRALRFRGKT